MLSCNNSTKYISIVLLMNCFICLLAYYCFSICYSIGLNIINTDDFIIQYFRNNGRCVLITEIIDMKKTDVFLKCYLYNTYTNNELL